jgi:hypothetical protein
VQVLSGVATDPATNQNTSSNIITTNFDSVAPTISQRTPDIGATVGNFTNITLQFSESVTGVTAGALTVNGSAATGVAGSGVGPYVFTGFTSPGNGTVTVALTGAAIQDAATNAVVNTNYAFTKDAAAVSVTLASGAVTDGGATHNTPVGFTATFARAVSNFIAGDISVTNGSVSGFSGSGANYAFNIIPSGQGAVSVQIPASVATGTAAPTNPNAASNNYAFIFDTVAPSVVLTPSTAGPTNAPFNISVAFSEATNNFVAGDLTVSNATISGFTGSGQNYSFTVNPTAQGAVSVSVTAGVATDAAGNNNTAGNVINMNYDSIAPTVVLTSTAPDPTNVGPIPFRATFSENVSGMSTGKITVNGGTVTGLVRVNDATYDFAVIPATGTSLVTVDIGPAKAQDAAGNQNVAATAAISRQFDNAAPSVAVSGPASPSNGSPIVFTITFNEPVTGFSATGLSIAGGTPGTLTGSGPYQIEVLPAGQGMVSCAVNAGVALDLAGNANGASNQLDIVYDSVAPTATVTAAAAATRINPIVFTINFTESVSGLSAAGLSVTGGVAGLLTGTGSGPYTLEVAPAGEGPVTCQVPAAAVADGAGNANPASNTASVTFDSVAPQVLSIVRQAPLAQNTNAASVTYRVTFDEPINAATLSLADFALTTVNGSLSGTAATGIVTVGPAVYDVVVNPGLGTGELRLDVLVPGALVSDLAGNDLGSGFASGESYSIDTNAPSGTLSSGVGSQSNAAFTVQASFSEAVASFGPGAITVGNGSAGVPLGSGAGPYTITIVPAGQGPVSVQILAGSITDLAGNPIADTNTITTNHDSLAPQVQQRAPDQGATVNRSTGITLTFTEPVSGVTAGNLTVNGSPADFVSGSGAGPYSFSGFDYPADGTINVALDGALIFDAAANAAGPIAWTYEQDTAALEVTLSSAIVPNGGATNSNPIPMLVTFSEPVDGFDVNDIAMAGAVATNFTGSDESYSFDLVPGGEWPIQITIPAGSCTTTAPPNVANNISNLFSLTFDATPPGVQLASGVPALTNAPFNVTVTFTEPVTDFGPAGLTLDHATVSNFTGAGASYSFTVNPAIAQGSVSVGLAAGVAHDAALNANTAGNTIAVLYDSVPPTVAGVSVEDKFSVLVNFSELLTTGTVTRTNFTLSGSGQGTFTATPDSVTHVAPGVWRLRWNTGQMRKDGDITITVGGVTDRAGNLIDLPNAGTALGAGLGDGPSLAILPVVPNMRSTPVDEVEFFFSEYVTGFDIGDLVLTRDGQPVSLSGVTLVAASASVYTIDLSAVTVAEGVYVLGVTSVQNNVKNFAGNILADVDPIQWVTGPFNAAQSNWMAYE